ncbi:MAG: hypothetical protein P8163_12725 [Candidatus Thiodiazotropha sp.]
MKIVYKKDGVSEKWFDEMASKITQMQESFISNMKSKIHEEGIECSPNSGDQAALGNTQDLEAMLDNVDSNSREFIAKLLDGMDEIIKSHDIKQ